MKKSTRILLFLLCVAQIGTIIGLAVLNAELENELIALQNNYYNQMISMQNQIDSIYAGVDRKMEAYTSLFERISTEYGECDGTAAVPVTVTVTPKAVTADTKVFLSVDDESIALERNGIDFSATFAVNMFEKYDAPIFKIHEGDTVYTETASLNISRIYGKYIPDCEIRFGGRMSYGSKRITMDRTVACSGADGYARVTLYVEKNGEVLDTLVFSDEEIVEFDRNFDVASGDVLKIYAVAEHESGFTQIVQVEEYHTNEERTVSTHYTISPRSIYDRYGVLVYDAEGVWTDMAVDTIPQ